ncbi:minichromosome maintenance domain-containing protein 2 [Sphaerodactylus townsendi]|uniref:minichromosome maintenance domain-containing protein 2 n=1 Tax=Sphaerodactylus townsendi TaxID=933632 RepID=UPI0020270AA5|nr:minichromosome maintenance domain-containing protein 2 [Sphaerodactylus townsendi]
MNEVALTYLDRSGGLQKFVQDCKLYNDSKQSYAVFRFLISVNPSDIAELDATLGNYILHEPVKATQIFQTVCFTAVKTLTLIQQLQTKAQMNIVLKLTHLPSLPCYNLSLCTFPFDYMSQRFYMSEGIVIAATVVTKYTQGARFVCSEETCPFSEGFQYIRVHSPGATESATVRNDFVCSLCSSSLQEDIKYRVLGDKKIIEMIDPKAMSAFQGFCSNKDHFRFQSFTVFLRDELANKMKIGNGYKIIGIPVCMQNGSQVTVCLEANSVLLPKLRDPPCISEKFKHLLALTSNSCWRFTAVLADSFASQVLPPGIYNTLKLALLLSLVQTNDRDEAMAEYLDLLVATHDTFILERLLNYSVCLVERGIKHIPSGKVFPTVAKDKHGTGIASIQAGSALLAKGGICFIGELSSYKKDKLEQLQSVLESRTATVFIPGKKYGEDTDQQISFPIQTSFWTFIDVDSCSRKHILKDDSPVGQIDLNLPSANLIDAFGLLIHCTDPSYCHSMLPVVNFILKKAVDPEEASYVFSHHFKTQDYEEFVAFAKNLHAELRSEAEKLIHGYYLASRRVRTHSIHGSNVSTAALKVLISLSEAHAKLSLRTNVLEEDALIAILLYESSLTLKHGASVFCVPPNVLFPFELNHEHSLDQRDVYLMQCHQQLMQFIATYGPPTHILSTED